MQTSPKLCLLKGQCNHKNRTYKNFVDDANRLFIYDYNLKMTSILHFENKNFWWDIVSLYVGQRIGIRCFIKKFFSKNAKLRSFSNYNHIWIIDWRQQQNFYKVGSLDCTGPLSKIFFRVAPHWCLADASLNRNNHSLYSSKRLPARHQNRRPNRPSQCLLRQPRHVKKSRLSNPHRAL